MISLGVLGSGAGSNLQAILDAIHARTLEASVAVVLSDQPGAFILKRAEKAGIPTAVIDCEGHPGKFPEAAQARTVCLLKEAGVELVCLAGFMRLIGKPLLEGFPERILNVHPSLLPAFPGLHAWEKAVEFGATESGCTVHVVDSGVDTGRIVSQARVPVLPEDTPGVLHARIQVEEHRLYPATIQKFSDQLGENKV